MCIGRIWKFGLYCVNWCAQRCSTPKVGVDGCIPKLKTLLILCLSNGERVVMQRKGNHKHKTMRSLSPCIWQISIKARVENITSLLLSVLLRVCSEKNNAKGNQRVRFFSKALYYNHKDFIVQTSYSIVRYSTNIDMACNVFPGMHRPDLTSFGGLIICLMKVRCAPDSTISCLVYFYYSYDMTCSEINFTH